MTTARPAAVVVLAAGAGTRMRSATPKVLHTLGGRTILGHALAAARGVEPERIAVVVRHERDLVVAEALACVSDALIVDQDDVPGTGRAVECALGALDAQAQAAAAGAGTGEGQVPDGVDGPVVVLAGDIPLLDAQTLGALLDTHVQDANAVTVLTTDVPDPTGYGRIVRDPGGSVLGIVEDKDASSEQRQIQEINSSVYVFDAGVLRGALGRLDRDNAQGEVYLTDVLALVRADGRGVGAVKTDDPSLVEGVNDRAQLAVLRAELNARVLERHMLAGVTIVDPATTWIDVDVDLAQDVTILPGTQLHGATVVGQGATVGPDTTLTDVEIGPGATIVRTHGSLAVIGPNATVGPFAYLRPGARLEAKGKIGTFVEVKNATIGAGSKVPHLTYVGDATIGEGSNIGAGSIFVNYDGVEKFHSEVGSQVRTGAKNAFIAPVRIGDGAYTGAGTVVRRDVPPGALAVSAGPQRTIEGWVERRRPGTASAAAAERALAGNGARAEVPAAPGSAAPPDTPAPDTPAPDTPPAGPRLSPQAQAERERAGQAQAAVRPTPPPSVPGQLSWDALPTPPEGDSAR
ncbi:MAG: bifunctional UDP-N-acetylglucosamine diphosphorylase/glucosamine-1-phosphate N-acetyltransferase GlmU [Cellulomonadaceae bacterium]